MTDVVKAPRDDPLIGGRAAINEDAFLGTACDALKSPIALPNKLEHDPSSTPSKRHQTFAHPPDGGFKAWLVVLGAFCATMATLGYANSWGVFQAYYEQTSLSDNTPSSIAWIGSSQYALIFLPGFIVGRLFDMGYLRHTVLISSIFLVVSTMIVAECSKYWHFLLVQGLMTGVFCGLLFTLALSVISQWFERRAGLAFGVVALGSSIGETTLPIASRRLILEIGFPWTMRILGFIQIATLIVANICLMQRLPPQNRQGPFVTMRPLRSLPFALYFISQTTTFLGLNTVCFSFAQLFALVSFSS